MSRSARLTCSSGVSVEVEPDRTQDDDAEAAQGDARPGGPTAFQRAVRSVDAAQGLSSEPDGRDAGEDREDEAQQAEGQRRPGATVERVGDDMGVRVGVHWSSWSARIRSRAKKVVALRRGGAGRAATERQ